MVGYRRKCSGKGIERVHAEGCHGAVVQAGDFGHKAIQLWVQSVGQDVGRVRLQGDKASTGGDAGGEHIEEGAVVATNEVGTDNGRDRLALQLVDLRRGQAASDGEPGRGGGAREDVRWRRSRR